MCLSFHVYVCVCLCLYLPPYVSVYLSIICLPVIYLYIIHMSSVYHLPVVCLSIQMSAMVGAHGYWR